VKGLGYDSSPMGFRGKAYYFINECLYFVCDVLGTVKKTVVTKLGSARRRRRTMLPNTPLTRI